MRRVTWRARASGLGAVAFAVLACMAVLVPADEPECLTPACIDLKLDQYADRIRRTWGTVLDRLDEMEDWRFRKWDALERLTEDIKAYEQVLRAAKERMADKAKEADPVMDYDSVRDRLRRCEEELWEYRVSDTGYTRLPHRRGIWLPEGKLEIEIEENDPVIDG